ncbi:hypothetical protein NC651_020490 [Populus alba x Populus x berolinensis]|uniref:Uncharacterized protein n=1 Tax=Populus tomentosa TaxID=118781 RepID=A0A8X7Z7S1_POPTO|nr:hypothetical protein POTOM_029911 [Populus tomentosa]KAJ6903016.1 hypothetical protein NC651_020490 [Populus alba x Populus x berolinensis]
MSAEFDLALVGVQLQLWILSLIAKTSVVASCCCLLCYMLLGCLQQRLNLVYSAISMPLRPIRTCSFGAFFYLFLFLRGALT